MRIKLKRLFQALVIPSVVLLLLVVNQLLAGQFADVRALAEEIEQAHRTREQFNTILSLHQDIETGQRGYVLTREPAFLVPYDHAETRFSLVIAETATPNATVAAGDLRPVQP